MAKKKPEGYLSAKESRRISRENRKITNAYEKQRKRKNVPESEYLTTMRDPMGRRTIYDVLDKKYKNLKYIGRLDFKTTGLLLLTNDGDFARKMSLPKNHIERTYIAAVDKYTKSGLETIRKGTCIDGITYRPMKVKELDEHNLEITVTEGKKNEIRIVIKSIGSPVKALHRISYGPIKLRKLGVGKILEIDKKTIDLVLKNF